MQTLYDRLPNFAPLVYLPVQVRCYLAQVGGLAICSLTLLR